MSRKPASKRTRLKPKAVLRQPLSALLTIRPLNGVRDQQDASRGLHVGWC